MTPKDRRELLEQVRADLIAEHRAALAELEPISTAYSRVSNRAQRLADQRQRVEDALNWFTPEADALVTPPAIEGMAEADLDAALNRG